MTTFVLLAGACHGGWWYRPLVDRLEGVGHRAVAPTLAGLEERPELGQLITLQTHVDQAAGAVTAAGESVVLVGHSYAGSVITAVADRLPEHVRALVYLDAFVPHDGETCWQLTNDEQRTWYLSGAAHTGYGVDPLPFFDARARPHPLATLVQACRLTGSWGRVPTKIYVEALDWPSESPMAASISRAKADPEFVVHSWHVPHNVLRDGPDRLFELLISL